MNKQQHCFSRQHKNPNSNDLMQTTQLHRMRDRTIEGASEQKKPRRFSDLPQPHPHPKREIVRYIPIETTNHRRLYVRDHHRHLPQYQEVPHSISSSRLFKKAVDAPSSSQLVNCRTTIPAMKPPGSGEKKRVPPRKNKAGQFKKI
jgi:hypothetical protein